MIIPHSQEIDPESKQYTEGMQTKYIQYILCISYCHHSGVLLGGVDCIEVSGLLPGGSIEMEQITQVVSLGCYDGEMPPACAEV